MLQPILSFCAKLFKPVVRQPFQKSIYSSAVHTMTFFDARTFPVTNLDEKVIVISGKTALLISFSPTDGLQTD